VTVPGAARPWTVLITARNFDVTPEPERELRDSGVVIKPSEYGRQKGDAGLAGDQLIELLEGVNSIIAGACRLTRSVIEASPSLRHIARRGVGFDSVDLESASEHGVLVTITPGVLEASVADHVFALMLAAARSIPAGDALVRSGGWRGLVGVELVGKTLGIVGFGRIGRQVAARAAGFSMRVLAYDEFPDEAAAGSLGVRLAGSLTELFGASDVISVNVPLTATTRRLVDARLLAKAKPGAIFVNTARGEVVDEGALAEALRSGRLFAAGVDTYEREPPLGSPLVELPNVVLSPHIAGSTQECLARANALAAGTVVEVMEGRLANRALAVNANLLDATQSPDSSG
jgi:D-3-phosphoglycerate dehydrogenase